MCVCVDGADVGGELAGGADAGVFVCACVWCVCVYMYVCVLANSDRRFPFFHQLTSH